jgi:hypothetical protein
VLNDIQKVSVFDVKNDFFKGNISFGLQALILFYAPGKEFHRWILTQCVLFGNNCLKGQVQGTYAQARVQNRENHQSEIVHVGQI